MTLVGQHLGAGLALSKVQWAQNLRLWPGKFSEPREKVLVLSRPEPLKGLPLRSGSQALVSIGIPWRAFQNTHCSPSSPTAKSV